MILPVEHQGVTVDGILPVTAPKQCLCTVSPYNDRVHIGSQYVNDGIFSIPCLTSKNINDFEA